MALPCLAQWSGEQEVLAVLPRSAWRRLRGLKHCIKDRAEVRGAFDLNLTGVSLKSIVFTFQLQLFSCKKFSLPTQRRIRHL